MEKLINDRNCLFSDNPNRNTIIEINDQCQLLLDLIKPCHPPIIYNPYKKFVAKIDQWIQYKKFVEFPYSVGILQYQLSEEMRNFYQKLFSFCFVSNHLLEILSSIITKTYIDIGSGACYLSFCLEQLHDKNPICVEKIEGKGFIPYVQMDGREWLDKNVRNYPNVDILLVWPPLFDEEKGDQENDLAFIVAKRMLTNNRLIYCGSGKGGITGSTRFFDYLQKNFVVLIKETSKLNQVYHSFKYVGDAWLVLYKVKNDCQ